MTPLRDPAERLRALRKRKRRLLAVFAHPDDESYGCAGALHRAGTDLETAVVLLCLTSGEGSSTHHARGMEPRDIRTLREERMKRVAARLGIDELLLPGLPDRRLAREPLEHVGGLVGVALHELRPQVVVGPDPRGVNGHPDHIAAHWAVRHALRPWPTVRFAMVAYLPETAEAVKPRLLFPTPAREIDAVLELTPEERDAKEDCLRIHEALVTVCDQDDPERLYRPPVERYDFLGEEHDPPVDDLFADLRPPGS